jgi:glycosyltransferase involved in cell wall biosynthesis
MADKPTVSILMAVYNDEDFVRESVESLLNQTFTDFEFLLTDDGSTDSSNAILSELAEKDERIHLIVNETNKGIPASQNHMISLAEGKYIARFDGDDVALPHRLQKSVDYLEAHPEFDALCGGVQLMSAVGDDICIKWAPSSGKKIMALMPVSNYITQSTLILKSEILKENPYDPVIRDGSEDYNLWKKIFTGNRYNLYFMKDVLIRYRLNPNSVRKIWQPGEDESYFYANVCFNQKRKLSALKYWKGLKFKSRIKFMAKFILPTATHQFFK